MASRCLLNGFLVIVLTMSLLVHNATGTSASRSDDEGGDVGGGGGTVVGGEGSTLSPSLIYRVTGVMDSINQQASETLNRTGSASSMLSRLQPATTKLTSEVNGNGLLAPEKKLSSGKNTLGRLQETKGRTMATTKKVVDGTIHNLQSTVSDIRRTISGDDWDDVSDDRRINSPLDDLLRQLAWRVRRSLSRGPTRIVEPRRGEEVHPWRREEVHPQRGEEIEPWRREEIHPADPWKEELVHPWTEVEINSWRDIIDDWSLTKMVDTPRNEEEIHFTREEDIYPKDNDPWIQKLYKSKSEREEEKRREKDVDSSGDMGNPSSEKVVVPPKSEEELNSVHPWIAEEYKSWREREAEKRKEKDVDSSKDMGDPLSGEVVVPQKSEEKLHSVHPWIAEEYKSWIEEEYKSWREREAEKRREKDVDSSRDMRDPSSGEMVVTPISEEELHSVHPWTEEEKISLIKEKIKSLKQWEEEERREREEEKWREDVDSWKDILDEKRWKKKMDRRMNEEDIYPVHRWMKEEVPPMHPLTRNSYNNTSNSLTNSDFVIVILIIIITII